MDGFNVAIVRELWEHYSKSDDAVKRFKAVLEKAGLSSSALFGESADLESIIRGVMRTCKVDLDAVQVYTLFQCLAEDSNISFIKNSYSFIGNLIHNDTPVTDYLEFSEIIMFSKFSNILSICKLIGVLKQRNAPSDACGQEDFCQLHDYVIKTTNNIGLFNKELYNVLLLLENFKQIYEQIDLMYELKNVTAGVPVLANKVMNLYDDIKNYVILAESDIKEDMVVQRVKDILNNTTILPEFNSKVDEAVEILELIRKRCEHDSLPLDNKDPIFRTILRVQDKIKYIIDEVPKHLQADIELSVSMIEDMDVVDVQKVGPKMKRKLVSVDTLKKMKDYCKGKKTN